MLRKDEAFTRIKPCYMPTRAEPQNQMLQRENIRLRKELDKVKKERDALLHKSK